MQEVPDAGGCWSWRIWFKMLLVQEVVAPFIIAFIVTKRPLIYTLTALPLISSSADWNHIIVSLFVIANTCLYIQNNNLLFAMAMLILSCTK